MLERYRHERSEVYPDINAHPRQSVTELKHKIMSHRTHDRSLFYKYTSAETAKIILESCSLRWSNPKVFNDPFDVPEHIFTEVDTSSVGEKIASLMRSSIMGDRVFEDEEYLKPTIKFLLEAFKNADDTLREQLLKECDQFAMAQPNSTTGLRMMQQSWEEQFPNQRIVCFSEEWNSSPMWNHYANEHKGVVLVFRCVDELNSATLCAKPVYYSNDTLKYNSARGIAELFFYEPEFAIRRFIHEYTHTKTADWAYEREWRLVSFKRAGEVGDFSDYKFFPEEIKGVIFGKDTSEVDIQEIISILDESRFCNYKLWKAKKGGGKFLEKHEFEV